MIIFFVKSLLEVYQAEFCAFCRSVREILLWKYLYQVPLYLFRHFIRESPNRSVSVAEVLAMKY